ncbi:tyrosine-type recombinase/integrase [Halioxenophilus aromaticivorans]|uniref:Tyrosine-type recombinase/integrase n=1 Tax=Halioxenophilus aromaticivorans TaxID=1306992 RepID=A0AAV3UAI4_9ALTE
MINSVFLGPWIRRFLLEHVVDECNLSRNTQHSYRDAITLLIQFTISRLQKPVDCLAIVDLSAEMVRSFLNNLEEERGCAVSTRNQRLAAIHAFARFVGLNSPEHISWSGEIRGVPFKKAAKSPVIYLEKSEMDALLDAPNINTAQGQRDHAILLFLYNSGARADEVAQLLIMDLNLAVCDRDHSSARLRGKGNKLRQCPLWAQTVRELRMLIDGRKPTEHVFLNRCGKPITRFGIHGLVKRYAAKASKHVPSITDKHVSPHVVRHTTASHLLRAGVDINTIRAWLGHVSLATTNIYAEADLEMKAKALSLCEIKGAGRVGGWGSDAGLMAFLRSL